MAYNDTHTEAIREIDSISSNDKCSSPSRKKFCLESNGSRLASSAVHVEVRLRKGVAKSQVEHRISDLQLALEVLRSVRNWKPISIQYLQHIHNDKPLSDLIHSVIVGCTRTKDGAELCLVDGTLPFKLVRENTHFYRPSEDGPLVQNLAVDVSSDDTTAGSQLWQLPCIEFENIWENLIYDSDIKNELMSYIHTIIHLSNRGVDTKIINVNRLILLLGSPGTGKTSLCKGMAHHLAIRLNTQYSRSVMVEINSHSLFSKWFSESGKLVLNMFDQIDELADNGGCMVFVLIDEVESLGMSRDTCSARGDPADSIRAVNALLTQIDRIRRRNNVVVLCTSNLENCLDNALLDRADVIHHVGQPSVRALYTILSGSIKELERIGLVHSDTNGLPIDINVNSMGYDSSDKYSSELLDIASLAKGLSGRCLRQVPALAWSKASEDSISLSTCLSLFREAIMEKKEQIT